MSTPVAGPFLLVSLDGDAPVLLTDEAGVGDILEPGSDAGGRGDYDFYRLLSASGFHAIRTSSWSEPTKVPGLVRSGQRASIGGLLSDEDQERCAKSCRAALGLPPEFAWDAAGPPEARALAFERVVAVLRRVNWLEER